jgi:hypothetical protein
MNICGKVYTKIDVVIRIFLFRVTILKGYAMRRICRTKCSKISSMINTEMISKGND